MLLALGGFFLVQAIEDFKESGHAFIAVTVLAALGGFTFLGIPAALLAAILAFAVQLTVYDFKSKKSALFPVALALTALGFAVTTFLLQANLLVALGVSVAIFLASVACDDYFLQRKHAVQRNSASLVGSAMDSKSSVTNCVSIGSCQTPKSVPTTARRAASFIAPPKVWIEISPTERCEITAPLGRFICSTKCIRSRNSRPVPIRFPPLLSAKTDVHLTSVLRPLTSRE